MKNYLSWAALTALIVSPVLAHADDMEKKTEHYFEKMDTNGDDQVSQTEHNNFASRMFTEADANKDGAVSLQEMREHKRQEKARYESETDDTHGDE